MNVNAAFSLPRQGPGLGGAAGTAADLNMLGLPAWLLRETPPLFPPPAAALGWVFILALIWLAIVKNACSTLVAVLAEVSRNSIPRLSANSFPCSEETTRLEVKSDLLPTSNLLTFSQAYLSISCSHCLTLLKDSLSVTS